MKKIIIAFCLGCGVAIMVYYGLQFLGAALWWISLLAIIAAAIFVTVRSHRREKRAFAAIIPALEALGEADFRQLSDRVKADTGVTMGPMGYAELHRLERLGVVEFKWSEPTRIPRRMMWRVTPRRRTTILAGNFGRRS